MREYSQKYRRDLCLSTCITTLLQHELPWLSTRDGPDAAHSQGEQALHKLLGEQLFNMQRLLTDPTALRRECQDAVQICTFLEENVYARNLVASYKAQLEGVLHAQPKAA